MTPRRVPSGYTWSRPVQNGRVTPRRPRRVVLVLLTWLAWILWSVRVG